MRRSEIARLRWQDIDFEDRTLCIAETKNDEPRTIPMSESLFSTLLYMKMKSVSEFLQHQRVSPIPLFLHGKGPGVQHLGGQVFKREDFTISDIHSYQI